jgi:hypothetical protein
MILDIYRDCFARVYIWSPSINVDHSWEPVKKYIEKDLKINTSKEKVYFEYQLFKLDGSLLDEGVSSSKMVELDPGVRFLLEGMKEGAHLTGTLQLYRDRSVGKVKVKEFVKLDLHLIALSDPSIYRRSDQPGLSETELRKEAISDRELVSLGGDCREYMVTRGYGEASSDYPDYETKCGINRSLSEAAEFGPVRYVKIDVPTGLDKTAFYGCKKYVLDLWYHPSWHEIGTYCMHREGQQVTTFNSFRRNPDGGYYSKFCGLKFLYCENRRTENETYFNYMLAE